MSLAETVSKIDHLGEEERECIGSAMKPLGSVWCADECLGDEEMEECARLCRDVADIASLHARFMARNSNYSKQLAEACAGACEECAEECERHDAEHCQVCAEGPHGMRRELCRNMMSA